MGIQRQINAARTALRTGLAHLFGLPDSTVGAGMVLAVFDKLVLSVLLLGVGAVVQARIADDSFRTELAAKMYETQTNLISAQRQDLMGKIGTVLDTARVVTLDPARTDANQLEQQIEAVSISAESLGAFYSKTSLSQPSEKLVVAMSDFFQAVINQPLGDERLVVLKAKTVDIRTAAIELYRLIDDATLAESVNNTAEFLQRARQPER